MVSTTNFIRFNMQSALMMCNSSSQLGVYIRTALETLKRTWGPTYQIYFSNVGLLTCMSLYLKFSPSDSSISTMVQVAPFWCQSTPLSAVGKGRTTGPFGTGWALRMCSQIPIEFGSTCTWINLPTWHGTSNLAVLYFSPPSHLCLKITCNRHIFSVCPLLGSVVGLSITGVFWKKPRDEYPFLSLLTPQSYHIFT